MSAAGSTHDRLLTFEVGSTTYALPIGGVLEVSEVGEVACIPTLARSDAGVVNHHGDALPVVERGRLLELAPGDDTRPGHLLVVGAGPGHAARLGLPVDRVLGLVDGRGARAMGPDPVAERRPIDGRLVSILDPERLVARARQVIERVDDQD